MERGRLSIRNVDYEALDMLRELRDFEQRHAGGIIGEAIRMYWSEVFADADDDWGGSDDELCAA